MIDKDVARLLEEGRWFEFRLDSDFVIRKGLGRQIFIEECVSANVSKN